MTSLCVWVLFVLVVPNLSPYFASLVAPAPSRIKVSREASRLTDVERDDLGRRLAAEKMRELVRQYPALAENLSEAAAKARAEKDPAYKEALAARTREVGAAWAEANRIQNGKAEALRGDLRRKEDAQTKLAGAISMASPLSDFTFLATDLTSTGLMNERHFQELSRLWDQAYGDYVRARIETLQKKDPAVDWWNSPVDVGDMPRFQFREEGLAARIAATLLPLGILAALALLAFGTAYVSFVKYDVR